MGRSGRKAGTASIIMEKTYQEIIKELQQQDRVLKNVANAVEMEIKPSPTVDVYESLLNSIVSQQLSTKVAEIIWKRFLDLFADLYPSPKAVLELPIEKLRAVGLSMSKANYLRNVAVFAQENDLSFEVISQLDDHELINHLVSIKGVGKWTAQMILMFPLDRHDVFPVDDLGIQTKMKHWYGLTSEKKELHKEMEVIAAAWSPYRSIASKLLWSSVIK